MTEPTDIALAETETEEQLYVDADGVLLNDLYHEDGKVRTDLPDGAYVNMPFYVYIAQDRLGSTDFVRLSGTKPESWWYGSRHNKLREVVAKDDAYLAGHALHTYVFDGVQAFMDTYVQSPHETYVSKAAKEWKAAVFAAGQVPLKANTYRNTQFMGRILANHEEMGPYLSGGLSEFTVFFTFDGVKMRARYDKLLMDAIPDLKTAGAHKDATFVPDGVDPDVWTCMRIIRDMKYSCQRWMYGWTRNFLRDFIRNHREASPLIHGASPAQMKWLIALAEVDKWDFVFLFYAKVNHSSKSPAAPVVTPIVREAADYTDEKGNKIFIRGLENYQRLVAQFGLDTPWMRVNRAQKPDDALFADLFGRDADMMPPVAEAGSWDDEDEDQQEETAA